MDSFKIDGNALEVECIKQMELMEHWAFESAAAKRDLDVLKHKLERIEIKVDTQVRHDPREYGVLKPSESAFKRVVEFHPDVRNAKKETVQGRARVLEADAALSCLDHRKRMLEQLIKLHGAGYFSEVNHEDVAPRYNTPTASGDRRPLRNPRP
jgi:hypothetical protein